MKTRHNHVCCGVFLLMCLSFHVASFAQATRTWTGLGADNQATAAGNWDTGLPQSGDHIVLDGGTAKNMTWNITNLVVSSWTQIGYMGTVTVATVYASSGFTNVNITGDCIISNGVWTHTANPSVNYEVSRLCATIGGDLIVGSNAMIDVSGKGYSGGRGPGGGQGASYGGHGDYYGKPSANRCYGSIIAPTNLGSGGSSSRGGGAILLNVAGTVSLYGTISANGNPSAYYTGSGGSIFLTAGALVGSAVVRANAGVCSGHSGGGGGRIGLVVTNSGSDLSGFTGTIMAYGNKVGNISGAGTIYRETSADTHGKGELTVDNNGAAAPRGIYTELNGTEAVTCEFSRITLVNAGVLVVGVNETLIATNTVFDGVVTNKNDGIVINGGTLKVANEFAFTNFFIRLDAAESKFSPAVSLTIPTNAVFYADYRHVMTTDVIVAPGGILTHSGNAGSETYRMNLTLQGNLTVRTGGVVDVTGCGYSSGNGPGTHPVNSCGASYGGLGVNGLSTYGSIIAPTNLGSGGRSGGSGGGAIIMTVSGVISNDGTISANAKPATSSTGSGGSINITAGLLAGAGVIEANSATNVTGINPGGGGRIALAVTNAGVDFSSFTGDITAYGGRKATGSGGAGTVYLRMPGQDVYDGILIVDNDDLNGLGTEISSNVTDTVVHDVFIRRNGILLLATNQTLTVSGVWSNAAIFEGQWNSAVVFAGEANSTSILYGSTAFMGLVCTNASGKTLQFEADATNTVIAMGRLILLGNETSTNLVLRSTGPGTAWNLNVDPLVEQVTWYVDVEDSNASGGAEVTALNSRNRARNTNWRFLNPEVGATNKWTGISDTFWTVRENWNLDRAPMEHDYVLIPAGCPNYPVFDTSRTVADIEIQTGGSLALNGYDLTVTNQALISGALVASDVEKITFQADVDFAGGSFTSAYSTILLNGAGNQSISFANLAFHKIAVLNNTGTVSFGNGFSATELRCESPGGVSSLRFTPGTIVAVRDLVLQGATGNSNIVLRSSSDNQKWNLAVSGYRSVRGVDVRDSDASSGLPIPAVSSANSGGNANWIFDVDSSVWLGTSSANFHTAANWLSGMMPDETSRVLMDSVNPMSITGAVTLLDFVVGGTNISTATVNAPLTITENITVLTNGILVLNRPCVVNNSLYVLGGGTLTHSANITTEANKLIITVFGDTEVDVNGAVNVTGRGYSNNKGPGGGQGGSYGGHGSYYFNPSANICYGSILAPTNLGSGGGMSPGGGAVIMNIGGTIRHDGIIYANGNPASVYPGSGGSVFIIAGALAGTGPIRANGGSSAMIQSVSGGGRIALVITNAGAKFSTFTGPLEAYSGVVVPAASDAAYAGAGTIYRQCAENLPGHGTVLVDNNNYSRSRYTDVPPKFGPTGEVARASFFVTNAARLRLTNDFTVGNIWLTSPNAVLDLGATNLYVNAFEHETGTGIVTNYGAIIWYPLPKGTVFFGW